jgi:hypothetical protein
MDARGAPASARQGGAWKKVGIGCLAVLGIGAIVGAVVVFLVVRKHYPWVFELGQASQEMVKRAVSSPAATELNRTLCTESWVMEMADFSRLQTLMERKGTEQKRTTRLPDFRWMVSCHVRDASRAPGCDRVASTFRRLVPDPGKFMVVVTTGLFRGAGKSVCTAAYDADGRPIRGSPAGGD